MWTVSRNIFYYCPILCSSFFEEKFLNNRVEPALANAQRKAGPEHRLFTIYIGSNYNTEDNKYMKAARILAFIPACKTDLEWGRCWDAAWKDSSRHILLLISTEFCPLADRIQHHDAPSASFPFSLLSFFSPFLLWAELGNWWRKKKDGRELKITSKRRLSNSLCPLSTSWTAEEDPEAIERPCWSLLTRESLTYSYIVKDSLGLDSVWGIK